jgi:uncharacterized membrane protein
MRIRSTLKSSFFAGLILIAPLAVTLFVFNLLVNWTFGLMTPLVKGTRFARFTFDNLFVAELVMGGFILLLVIFVGYAAQYSVGRQLFGRAERLVNFIPLVRIVYVSVRQMANSVVSRESRFERVVFVEYPRDDIYSVGLVTGDGPPVAGRIADEDVYNVFFPASPNPTNGRLVLVPESNLHETGLSVRQGIQLLMTTGLAESPPMVEYEENDEEDLGSVSG